MAFNVTLIKRKEHKSPESPGNHKITIKTAQNFHFRTKNSPIWMILESRQRKEEKGSPIKLQIEFYF